MDTTNNAKAHPRDTFIAQVAITAVNNANPIVFSCLLEASLLSVKEQSAKTDNSR